MSWLTCVCRSACSVIGGNVKARIVAAQSELGERTDKRGSVASSPCSYQLSRTRRCHTSPPRRAKSRHRRRPVPLSAQRLLQLGHIVLPRGVFACKGDSRGREGRTRGRQAEVFQDLLHDLLLRDESEHDPAAAAGTEKHVLAKHAQQKLCPGNARRVGPCALLGWRRIIASRRGILGAAETGVVLYLPSGRARAIVAANEGQSIPAPSIASSWFDEAR